MHTPFNAELPNLDVVQDMGRVSGGEFVGGQPRFCRKGWVPALLTFEVPKSFLFMRTHLSQNCQI